MTRFRSSFPLPLPGRFLALAGIAILLCLVTLSGCTQPMIPAPGPVSTTPPLVATTQATAPPPVATTMATQIGQQAYLPYTNSQYGFSMSYPSGWTMQENTGGSVVVFTAPLVGTGNTPTTMKVSVEDLSANRMSLEQYKAAQITKKQATNLIYDQAFKAASFTGWKIGYTYNAGTLIDAFEIYTIRGTTAYTLAFTTRDDRFAGYASQMDTMTKSFQLTG